MRQRQGVSNQVRTYVRFPPNADRINYLFSFVLYGASMDESSVTQNRRSARSPVMLSAKLELGGQAQPVVLRNLSTGGALVEGTWLPAEGSAIIFARNELRVQAKVAWVSGTYAGVAFECALD